MSASGFCPNGAVKTQPINTAAARWLVAEMLRTVPHESRSESLPSSICHPPSSSGSVTVTDAPALVDLKAQYRQLDDRHEVVKAWVDSLGKDAELYRICVAKAEIAQRVLMLGHEPS